ncbi:hypothetical protein ACFC26_07695 [Kitasatospora purpeofusca]|uniref:hypothetical protein n=1 Tax=Kitasatospora purpeofusca TaxID=67352 RepID=UPI0035D610C3
MSDTEQSDSTPEQPSGDRWVNPEYITVVEAHEMAKARGADGNTVRLFITHRDG